MEFTYLDYINVIKNIKNLGYRLCFYDDYCEYVKPCIMRHDIDFSVDKALEFAKFEASEGVQSTYFFLLTSCNYNALSKSNIDNIKTISSLGHRIGLHFDETIYDNKGHIVEEILNEKSLMEHLTGLEIKYVSMHEPSPEFLSSNMSIPGMVNTYSKQFFSEMKYYSDSMRKWRMNLSETDGKHYRGLQVLTHPIWWNNTEKTQAESLADVMNRLNDELNSNIIRIYPDYGAYRYEFK